MGDGKGGGRGGEVEGGEQGLKLGWGVESKGIGGLEWYYQDTGLRLLDGSEVKVQG